MAVERDRCVRVCTGMCSEMHSNEENPLNALLDSYFWFTLIQHLFVHFLLLLQTSFP